MENYIMMYEKLPNLVLGFHGCDKSTYEKVLKNHENLKTCDNTYDWLGNGDILLRDLDCAVIQQIHQYHKETAEREYDSVRGVFIEGKEAYPGAGFKEKTHIQLCVINPNCIKGFFSPRRADSTYLIP